jgi:ATP-dependent DNA ligase
MLVFFDILYRDGSSCLNLPYEMRRAALEAAIAPQPQFVMLADRYRINSTHPVQRKDELTEIFGLHLSKFEEGVVLKAGESRYHDWHLPWVKVNPHITS